MGDIEAHREKRNLISLIRLYKRGEHTNTQTDSKVM
jgi:hypothetical protein